MEWFSVKEKLPKHLEVVLANNISNKFVAAIFIDREMAKKELSNAGFDVPDEFMNDGLLYNFCSLEIKGNVFNDITHWGYIGPPKEKK